MTVKELIEELKKEDGERLVVMSCDGEGNRYSPFADFSAMAYLADSTWSGEVGFEKLTPTLKKQGYTEEDVVEGGVPALVLYPTN